MVGEVVDVKLEKSGGRSTGFALALQGEWLVYKYLYSTVIGHSRSVLNWVLRLGL